MTWRDAMVVLYVPTSVNGNGTYGTAFSVAPDLVLTARHVVRPCARDPSKRIRVKWWESAAGWCDAPADEDLILWESTDYDIALLRCPRPDDMTTIVPLNAREPKDHMQWAGRGFPNVTVEEDLRKPGDFKGGMTGMGSGDRRFSIEASTMAPKTEEDWRGASGMPVIVDDRAIGVCLSVPHGRTGAVIVAAPMAKILRVPGDGEGSRPTLADILHAGTIEGRLEDAVRKAAGSQTGIDAIVRSVGVDSPNGGEPPEDWIQAVVAKMLTMPTKPLFAGLYKEAARAGGEADIYELARVVAPCLFQRLRTTFATLSERSGVHDAAVTGLAVGTHTMAEFAVAATQKRDAAFHKRIGERDMPPGQHLIPLTPVPRGGVSGSDPILWDIVCDLAKFYSIEALTRGGPFRPAAEQSLCHTFGMPHRGDVIDSLNSMFETYKDIGLGLPYFAVYLEGSPEQRCYIKSVLEDLCDKLPDLIVIIMNENRKHEDYDAFGVFNFLVPHDPASNPIRIG